MDLDMKIDKLMEDVAKLLTEAGALNHDKTGYEVLCRTMAQITVLAAASQGLSPDAKGTIWMMVESLLGSMMGLDRAQRMTILMTEDGSQ